MKTKALLVFCFLLFTSILSAQPKVIHLFLDGPIHAITSEYVIKGTPAHEIRSHGPWPLRNRATGQVFGPRVHHPGTAANNFVERAVAEVAGERVVERIP